MRRPRWQDQGRDPDYQSSMSNEQTFLAWLRTSLALLAAAVAVAQLVPAFRITGGRTLLGVMLAVLGIVVAALAYLRWAAVERAMRLSLRMRYPVVLPLLATLLSVVGVLVLLLVSVGPK
jgi:putative membrane protein